MANWFNLNGALLRIDAEDPALVKPLLVYLDELGIQSSERTPDFRLVLERGLPQPPPPEACPAAPARPSGNRSVG